MRDRSHAQGGKRLYKPEPVSHRNLCRPSFVESVKESALCLGNGG
jgi:hypothetical protein